MINYLKLLKDGTQVATKHKPLFQLGERLSTGAGEQPDILIDGEWWSSIASTAEGEEFEPDTKYPVQFIYASEDGHLLNVVVENGKPVSYFFDGSCPTLVLNCLQVGRLETTENRVEMYLEDYGVPQIVAGASPYTINNPFGNDKYKDCDTKLEIYDTNSNDWIEITGSIQNTSGSSFGVNSSSTSNGIVINTCFNYIAAASGASLGIQSKNITASLVSAPARVVVTYKGKTKRIKP